MRTPTNLKKARRSLVNLIGKLRASSSGPSSAKSSAKSSSAFHFEFPEELTTPRPKETVSKASEKTDVSGESDIDFVTFVRSVSTSPSVRDAKGTNAHDEYGLDRYDSMYPEDDPAGEAWDTTNPVPVSPAGSRSSLGNANSLVSNEDMQPLPSPSGIRSAFSSESERETGPKQAGVQSFGSLGCEAPIPVLQKPPIQSGIKTMNPTSPVSLSADAAVNWSSRTQQFQKDASCNSWLQVFSCVRDSTGTDPPVLDPHS